MDCASECAPLVWFAFGGDSEVLLFGRWVLWDLCCLVVSLVDFWDWWCIVWVLLIVMIWFDCGLD